MCHSCNQTILGSCQSRSHLSVSCPRLLIPLMFLPFSRKGGGTRNTLFYCIIMPKAKCLCTNILFFLAGICKDQGKRAGMKLPGDPGRKLSGTLTAFLNLAPVPKKAILWHIHNSIPLKATKDIFNVAVTALKMTLLCCPPIKGISFQPAVLGSCGPILYLRTLKKHWMMGCWQSLALNMLQQPMVKNMGL